MRSNDEKKKALSLRNDGLSFREIGENLNMSTHSARSLCMYKNKNNKKKRGPKTKISKMARLCIKRRMSLMASTGVRITSPKLIEECNLDANVRTVQQYLRNQGYKYKRATKEIVLTKNHKTERIRMITSWIENNQQWEKTIFSDEKRFCLDGLDDWRSYTLKSKKIYRQKRQCGGGGLMIWMMLMPNGLLCYDVIDGKFNSDRYIQLLDTKVVPIMKLNYGSDFLFQEDNATVHKAQKVANFWKSANVNILQWPAKSPDLNIVEDVWARISDIVYDGSQFRNNKELLKKIDETIYKLCTEERHKLLQLYKQIRGRLCKVLQQKGNLYNRLH